MAYTARHRWYPGCPNRFQETGLISRGLLGWVVIFLLWLPASGQSLDLEVALREDTVLQHRLGLGPEVITRRFGEQWVVGEGDFRALNQTWPSRLTPVFTTRRTGILDADGTWVVPISGQYIGYLGNGCFWSCRGGELRWFCTYPAEVVGGKYSLVRKGAKPLADLDDVWHHLYRGLTLVMRDGKVAMVDSLLQMRTGFDFDQALVNQVPREDDTTADHRIWIWALRRLDGQWMVMDQAGKLLDSGWPQHLEVEDFSVGMRTESGRWLQQYTSPFLSCFSDLRGRERPHYEAPGLGAEDIFPSEARLMQYCDSLRERRLQDKGLELRHRGNEVALARLGGKRITDYSTDRYEPMEQGWVRRLHMRLPSPASTSDPDGLQEGDESGAELIPLVGLIHQDGKRKIPSVYEEVRVLTKWNVIEATNSFSGALYDLNGNRLTEGSPLNYHWSDEELICWAVGKESQVWDRNGKMLYRDTLFVREALREGNWIWIDVGDSKGFTAHALKGSAKVLGPVLCNKFPNAAYRFQLAHPEMACEDCYLDSLDHRFWRIGNGDGVGIADAHGNWVIPRSAGWDWITLLEQGFDIETGGLHGFANSQGVVLIQPEFFSVTDLGGGRIQLVRFSGNSAEYAEIDAQGKFVRDWH